MQTNCDDVVVSDSNCEQIESDSLGEGLAAAGIAAGIGLVNPLIGREVRSTVFFKNATNGQIELHFQKANGDPEKRPKVTVKSGSSKSYNINPKDGMTGTTCYYCEVWFESKYTKFWAYGEEVPRFSNDFDIRDDGIWILQSGERQRDHRIAEWQNNTQ